MGCSSVAGARWDVAQLQGPDGMQLSCRGPMGCSSIGRASDRHAAGAGSIPRCGEGFSSQSQLSVQTLLRCPYTPRVQSHALISVRTLKILQIQFMSEFGGLQQHRHTQHAPQRQNNQLDNCGRSIERRRRRRREKQSLTTVEIWRTCFVDS